MKQPDDARRTTEKLCLYALGILDPERVGDATAQLSRDDAAAEALRDFERIRDALGYVAPAASPPSMLRTRLLADLSPAIPVDEPKMIGDDDLKG